MRGLAEELVPFRMQVVLREQYICKWRLSNDHSIRITPCLLAKYFNEEKYRLLCYNAFEAKNMVKIFDF